MGTALAHMLRADAGAAEAPGSRTGQPAVLRSVSWSRIAGPGLQPAGSQVDQARMVARRLAAAGRPVSRRALRSGGVTGSNEALNALARMLSAELARCAGSG